MPRTRYVDVPESDTEIIEEEITQRKTSRGVSIKKVRTPMTQSLPTTAEKASGSQSKIKKKLLGPQAVTVAEMAAEDPFAQTYEPGNDFEHQLDDFPEESQSQTTVCWFLIHAIYFICSIFVRLLWTNGLTIGAHTSMCFWKWKVGARLQSAHSAQRVLHISSVQIVSEAILSAGLAVSNIIGDRCFTAYFNGMDHTICRYPCTHWGSFYFLGTMGNLARKLLRYVRCKTVP